MNHADPRWNIFQNRMQRMKVNGHPFSNLFTAFQWGEDEGRDWMKGHQSMQKVLERTQIRGSDNDNLSILRICAEWCRYCMFPKYISKGQCHKFEWGWFHVTSAPPVKDGFKMKRCPPSCHHRRFVMPLERTYFDFSFTPLQHTHTHIVHPLLISFGSKPWTPVNSGTSLSAKLLGMDRAVGAKCCCPPGVCERERAESHSSRVCSIEAMGVGGQWPGIVVRVWNKRPWLLKSCKRQEPRC